VSELVLSVGGTTDVGLRRRVNEDSVILEHPIFAVADGMGGHDAGDRASQAVVRELRALVGRDLESSVEVSQVIDAAHVSVRSIADETSRGAGSTLSGAAIVLQARRPHWLVFNIGDSRVYRLLSGALTQLTVDHSLAQELVDDGRLAREDVPNYQAKNVITKAVGADDSAADLWLYPVVTGETLLMCSDGLTGEVGDDAIREVLGTSESPQAAADRLVALALQNGGRDNVSVVVVAVESGGIDADLDESTGVVPTDNEPDADTIQLPRKRPADAGV
jgi:protein phosphatase